jgi:hypothetical protein
MKTTTIICSLLLSLLFLSGCSSLENFFNDNQGIYDASVRIAATRVINNDAERADRFEEAATLVKAWAAEESPVGLIDTKLRAQIDWSRYEADEQVLIDEFLRYLKAELEARINAGDLEISQNVLIAHTADLVLEVTARY